MLPNLATRSGTKFVQSRYSRGAVVEKYSGSGPFSEFLFGQNKNVQVGITWAFVFFSLIDLQNLVQGQRRKSTAIF
jgi:hypothetical protein